MISEVKENRQTLGATFHPKIKKFLTYGDDATLHLYDEETMTVEQVFERGLVLITIKCLPVSFFFLIIAEC